MSQWDGREIVAYSDGACLGNPGPGGWAAVVTSGGGEPLAEHAGGGGRRTTSNRMELNAAIEALERTRGAARTTMCTDSQYVKNGITQWISAWKRKGWRNAAGKPVKNRDLWERLDAACAAREVEWRWVRGHSGIAGNERADALASEAAQRAGDGTPAPGAPGPAADTTEMPFEGTVAELRRALAVMREETRVSCVLRLG